MGNFPLSNDEITVLNRGLSFVIAPEEIRYQTIFDALSDFKRRMFLHYHFFIKPTNSEKQIFRKKSSWQPPKHNQKSLEQYINNITIDIDTLLLDPFENIPNLKKTERNALDNLKNNNDFIIKPADKGGKIVLWPTHEYILEANRQLEDQTYYEIQPSDQTTNLSMEIETFLTFLEIRKLIDRNCHRFLSPSPRVKIPTFYMLPKIHKQNCPGRPIIAGCSSPTRALSKYLDHYLKPIVKKIPSYIKDTNHFLQIVLGPDVNFRKGDLLVTMDVKSLYTNIPQDEGIRCCLQALQNHYNEDLPLPLIHLEQMFTFILKRNYFEFNKRVFLQIHGTAMGSPFAPNFANIFMHQCEKYILDNAPNNRTPLVWKRYIDDIFLVWRHGIESLNEFLEFCNSSFPTIKFTAEYSFDSVNFLDTTIFFNPQGIIETLYIKPNDICTLLHNDSFHPDHCKKGIIYSQALRYRRIITNNEKLQENLFNLQSNLLRRG